MRVLVTGATGFIGKALCHRLRVEGHEVVVLSRNIESARRHLPFADAIYAWRTTNKPPPEAMRGVDAVVNLAGESVSGRWTEAKKQRIRDSRILGTQNLVAAMREAGIPTLVSSSAIGYYGERGEETLTEASTSGTGYLAGIARDWEAAAEEASASGIRVVTLRIGIVLGDGGALEVMLPPFRYGLGARLASGQQWWSWVHLDDVVGAIEKSLKDPEMRGAYNVTAPEPLRQRDFAGELAMALGRPVLFWAPGVAMRLALGEFADEVLQSKRVLPERLQNAGYVFHHPTARGALVDILGHPAMTTHVLRCEQHVPLDLATTYEFYASAGNLERLTPPWLRFRIKSAPEALTHGSLIDYRLRIHGVPISWRSEITSWDPPHRFVDQQLRGPYRLWRHTHTFEPAPDGGTIVRDEIEYAVPGPWFIERFFVRRDLAKIFDYRRDALTRWVEERRG